MYTKVLTLLICGGALVWSGCSRQPAQENQTAQTQPAEQPPADPNLQAEPVPQESPGSEGAKKPQQKQYVGGAYQNRTTPAKPAEKRAAPPPAPAPPPPPKPVVLAEGTPIRVRTTNALSTKTAATGETFTATLEEPIVEDGKVIAAKGATVTGVVSNSDPGGRVKGVASLSVRLKSIELANGKTLDVSTSAVGRQAAKSTKKDALKIGIGSGIGAAIGAIAGGGKGAAIGAAAGGGAGTGAVLATRGEAAVIPSETVLTFSLSNPVTVP